MALLEKELVIKESQIPGSGKGLFTNVAITKGTRIVEYKGRIKTWKEVKDDYDNFYIFFVNKNHIIDANGYKKSFARYLNDAQGLKRIKGLVNNTEFLRDGLKVYITAKKNIQAGEELFVSYGKEYWDVIRNNLKL